MCEWINLANVWSGCDILSVCLEFAGHCPTILRCRRKHRGPMLGQHHEMDWPVWLSFQCRVLWEVKRGQRPRGFRVWGFDLQHGWKGRGGTWGWCIIKNGTRFFLKESTTKPLKVQMQRQRNICGGLSISGKPLNSSPKASAPGPGCFDITGLQEMHAKLIEALHLKYDLYSPGAATKRASRADQQGNDDEESDDKLKRKEWDKMRFQSTAQMQRFEPWAG